MIPTDPQLFERQSSALPVPSPPVGEGQGGGCHTGTLSIYRSPSLNPSTPFPGPPLSHSRSFASASLKRTAAGGGLRLPRKGGGSADCLWRESGSCDRLEAEKAAP
ncbi:hypothetical protein EI171_04950 [Bradyrhizobium sp. LCT2]|nr:hypothetical protein EI171_04950 [Bradyrhizobium sp. LCT2]